MGKHEVVIHENTGATKEAAPYLGSYISKETVHEYTFATTLAAKCGLPAIQVMAILDGVFTEIEKLEQESLVRVHMDGFTICGVIRGSFPSADAAFDPARNSLELALRLDDSIKLDLADVSPTIMSDLQTTKVRVDNVMDLAEPKPFNVIHGKSIFRVAGFNMVLDDEGAATFLQNGLGQTFDLVVDEVVSKQLFKAHATGVPAGDYKLVVKSRGGDAEGPLQTSFRKVKVLAAAVPPAPEITKCYSSNDPSLVDIYTLFTNLCFDGNNLAEAAVKFKMYTSASEEQEFEVAPEYVTYDGDTLVILSNGLTPTFEEHQYGTAPVTFTITTPGGSVSRNVTTQAG